MKKSSYWQDRFIKEEQRRNKDARAYIKTIEKQYDQALSNIEKDINNWYMRIAKNNNISLLEAKKLLSKKELAEFKWEVEDYIKAGEANSSSPTWIKELENASARVHISRLEALKLQIQNEIESLYGTRDKEMQNYLIRTYGDTYYHAAYEIQKGIGLGSSVYSLDTNKVNQIIHKPWAVDGKNFSERIWEDKNKLINTLHNELTQSFIRGSSPYQIVSDIAKEFDVKKSVAGRLVMTESAAYAAKAQENCYKDLGIDQYEIVATLDTHTSPICQEMDGKVFSIKEYEVGVTANPFHPNCRTVTAPYFAEEMAIGERAARGKDGKVGYIPQNITYKEWYSEYIDGDKILNEVVQPKVEEKNKIDFDFIPYIEKKKNNVRERKLLTDEEIIKQAQIYAEEIEKNPDILNYDNGEVYSDYLNKKLGYDTLPQVVSDEEFKRLSKGKEILYRGIHNDEDLKATDLIKEFKEGKFYAGKGIFGHGTYVDPDLMEAAYYALDEGDGNGEIMEMVLSDDTKIISYLDILNQYDKIGIYREILTKRAKNKKAEIELYKIILGDVARYASIKGYDVISLDGFANKKHKVILNRGKVIVNRKNIKESDVL